MTIGAALAYARKRLRTDTNPALDAELLLAQALTWERAAVLAHPEATVSPRANLHFRWLVWQRKRGVPLAYLRGAQDFYGRDFFVNRGTLIPRPDTEVVVERALALVREHGLKNIIDVGTGSGCIAITLALELPTCTVYATDNSERALRVAKKNTVHWGATKRITFLHGNLLEPLQDLPSALLPNTLLIANLPYLKSAEVQGELTFEPQTALVSGADGLEHYQTLFSQLNSLERNSRPGWLVLEMHPPTAAAVAELCKQTFTNCHTAISPDLAGLPRTLAVELDTAQR